MGVRIKCAHAFYKQDAREKSKSSTTSDYLLLHWVPTRDFYFDTFEQNARSKLDLMGEIAARAATIGKYCGWKAIVHASRVQLRQRKWLRASEVEPRAHFPAIDCPH
jgi:hypothetical protein